jgi:NADH-quinone oxidoreductase subunit A
MGSESRISSPLLGTTLVTSAREVRTVLLELKLAGRIEWHSGDLVSFLPKTCAQSYHAGGGQYRASAKLKYPLAQLVALRYESHQPQGRGGCSLPRSSNLAHLRPSPFMPSLLDQYLPLAIFMAVAAVISGALLVAPFLVAFKAPDPEKLSAYECGFNAFDDARMRFDVRFYLVSLLFIIFDLEVAFLFPWAVAFREVGAFGFWSMMIFLGVLTVGFIYEWRKGALEWD